MTLTTMAWVFLAIAVVLLAVSISVEYWSGTSWMSVPPSATFSTWMPRQMHSIGMSRSRLPRHSASSSSSRRAWMPYVRSWTSVSP